MENINIYNLNIDFLKITDKHINYYKETIFYNGEEVKNILCYIPVNIAPAVSLTRKKEYLNIPLYINQTRPEQRAISIFYVDSKHWVILFKELRKNKKLYKKFIKISNCLF